MIKSKAYKHGQTYYYKVDFSKLNTNKGFIHKQKLRKYFYNILKTCPNHKFGDGPRSSSLKLKFDFDLQKVKKDVSMLARMGLDSNYYGDNHMNVQMFMLAYDKTTIAMEVPVWLDQTELKSYKKVFDSEKSLSGHIDIVRVENDLVWIWDYKPNAHREKFADTQTYLYALMLSKRTKIPLKNFRCGYFDDKNVYVFNPITNKTSKKTLLVKN